MSTDAPAESRSTFCPAESRIYVLIAAILASAMGFIDGAVLSIAIPALRADLGAGLAEATWISNAYLLFLSSLLLIGGAAGDRFGIKRVFAIGIGLFVVASMVCAIAPTPLLLIIARSVQGVGAALMVPGSLAIIAAAYPRDQRGWAIGIWAAASSLTTILGPIIGGFLLTALGDWSWRLVFAVNLPLGGISLALLLWRVPNDQQGEKRRLDLVGAALVTVGLLALAWGLTGDGSNGSVPPMSHVLLWCGAGIVLLAAFLFWEARTKEPMMPLSLFRNVSFAGANGLTFALYAGLAGVSFYLPMTMIAGWGESPAVVSIALAPLGIVLTLLSSHAGKYSDRFGPGPLIAAGSVLVAISFALMGLTAPLHNVWFVLLPLTTLFGLGMALVVSPLSTAVMTALDDKDTGIASGVNNAVARVAGLLAVAIGGGIAAIVFERALGPAAEQAVFFGLSPETPLDAATEAARVAATDAAFAAVAYAMAALSAVSAVIAWFTLEKKIGKR
jgi:EmrB/QacA subfamily drug resistance transporter